MKKIILLALAFTAFAGTAYGAATTEKRLTHKFANAGSRGSMNVDSKYGHVSVRQWDNAFAEITVDIKVKARREDDAQRMLDNITVSFSESGSSAYAKTNINFEKNSGNRNIDFEVHYTVNIPAGMDLNVENKYGNVHTGDLDGKLNATLKYGNIDTGDLNTSSNVIDIKYGNADIRKTPDLKLSIGYGNINAEAIGALSVDSKYSTISIGTMETLNIRGSAYDNYDIKEVETVKASSGTAGLEIGTLRKSIVLPGVKYGNIVIRRVEPGFEKIEIKASYSSVQLRFAPNDAFGYDLRSRYGSISINGLRSENRIQKTDSGRSSEFIGGVNGHTGNNASVTVSASYGNIELGSY